MLAKRVGTAVIGLPILIWAFASNIDWLLIPLFVASVAIGCCESFMMLTPRLIEIAQKGSDQAVLAGEDSKSLKYTMVTAAMLAIFVFAGSLAGTAEAERGMTISGLLTCILVGAFSGKTVERRGAVMLSMLFSVCYGALPWLSIWDLYQMGSGSRYVMLLIAIVWSGDTGAYFAGSAFGKHPLAPTFSPKKTWEGAVAGIVSSVVGGLLVNYVYGSTLADIEVIVFVSIVCGAVGQMGDLIESALKRFCDVKDSGRLLPGHGGFLDRVDGLLFSAPVMWFVLYNFKA